MSFELAASLRRIKPQRRAARVQRRSDSELPFVGAPSPGAELLLDTCVYIDVLQDVTPPEIDALLQMRIVNHSAVALSELTHLFGRLDPMRPETKSALASLTRLFSSVPAHRIKAPGARTHGEAGMLAGLADRLVGDGGDRRRLNDALLFLQARELGCTIVTRSIADFDCFDQLLPGTNILFYRRP